LLNPHELTGTIAKTAKVRPKIESKFGLYL